MRVLVLALLLPACKDPASDVKTPVELGPIEVAGYGSDARIGEDGDSQAEPSTVALEDGTVLASWMQLNRYSLYVNWSRSTDEGKTWTEPEAIDPADDWGYQNDPVLVQGGGYVYFTWLAVESANADKSSIYCVDSTDGGATWSEKVRLSPRNSFVDRQWMDVDDDGRAVITWDRFPDEYSSVQDYAESDGGCDGFSEPEEVASGYFLNGVPAIDAAGDIWISRNEFDFRNNMIDVIVERKDGDSWDQTKLLSTGVNWSRGVTAFAEDPAEEQEERRESIERAEEGERYEWARNILSPGLRTARNLAIGGEHPMAAAGGDFDGTYSPVLGALADGGLVAVASAFEDDLETPDAWILTLIDGEITQQKIGDDAEGIQQMEPWLVVDPQGGVHVSFFDDTEGNWRLYGATSTDGAQTFTTYPIGDDTFRKGFDDYDAYAWVGHFQGLTATTKHVIAVWGDSSEDSTSFINVDVSR